MKSTSQLPIPGLDQQSSFDVAYETNPNQAWESINHLTRATNANELEVGFDITLQAGQELSGASELTIYRADNQNPELISIANWNKKSSLPKKLPAQDLFQLRRPKLWIPGKRCNTLLHQAARASHLSYLASAPLGHPNAYIGLLAIADTQTPPSESILSITELMTNTITSLIEQHAKLDLIQSELENKQHRINEIDILEEQISEGLILLDHNLKIQRLNLSAEMILGYAGKEVLHQPVEKILIGTETLLPALIEAQQGKSSYNLGNLRLYRRNGEAFIAIVRMFPIFGDENVEGVIILINDLSEKEAIRIQTQQLEQRAILGEITAIFAHEVRNPINNISTGLQLMAHNLPENDPNQDAIDRLFERR